MPYGTHKLLGAASTAAAWKDWHAIQSWCEQNGQSELAGQHAPKEAPATRPSIRKSKSSGWPWVRPPARGAVTS